MNYTNKQIEALKKKWIEKITSSEAIKGMILYYPDKIEILAILKHQEEKFTKEELDSIIWFLSSDTGPKDTLDRAKRMRDLL